MGDDIDLPDSEEFIKEIDFNDFELSEFLDKFRETYKIENTEGIIGYSGEAAKTLEFLLETYTYVYDIDTGWGIEGATLARLYDEISEIDTVVNEVKERPEFENSEYDEFEGEDFEEEVSKHIFHAKASDRVLLFFTLVQEVIKPLTVDLLMKELIHQEHQSNASRKFVSGTLNQPEREELLFRCGVIDGGFKGKLAQVRTTRNALTHNLRERHLLESVDNLSSELNNSIEVVNELHERVEGFPLLFEEER